MAGKVVGGVVSFFGGKVHSASSVLRVLGRTVFNLASVRKSLAQTLHGHFQTIPAFVFTFFLSFR